MGHTGNAIQSFDGGLDLGFEGLVIVFLLLDGRLVTGTRRIHQGMGWVGGERWD